MIKNSSTFNTLFRTSVGERNWPYTQKGASKNTFETPPAIRIMEFISPLRKEQYSKVR